ncbi:unnamed protein product [Blepharisma stoltei]|uniref:Uncharacterized protein n=1 Tax=Blepharisma stoltei TaxID=1481888 RepID=A0AAU9K2Z8_9CILI|nr:unnamed protein product [Blepharisma stoltei]
MMKKTQKIREKCTNYCWVYYRINLWYEKINKEISVKVENKFQFIRDNKFYDLKNESTFEEIKQNFQKCILPLQREIGIINEINRLCLVSSWFKSKYEEYVEDRNKIYKKTIERLELLQNDSIRIDWLENCMSKLQPLLELLELGSNKFSIDYYTEKFILYFWSLILVKEKNSIFSNIKQKYLQSFYTETEQNRFFLSGKIPEVNVFDNFLLQEGTYSLHKDFYRKYKRFFNEKYLKLDKINYFEEIIANSQLMSLLKSPNNKLINDEFLYYENAIYFYKDATFDKNKDSLDFLCRYDLVKNTLNKYWFMRINKIENKLAFFNKSIIALVENERKIVTFDLLIDSYSMITYSDNKFKGWKFLVSYKINDGIHGIVVLRCTPYGEDRLERFLVKSLLNK